MKFFIKNKKGAMSGKIAGLIGALVLIVLATSLAPTMFSDLNITGAPTWLAVVLPVIVAAGLIFIIWRAFSR